MNKDIETLKILGLKGASRGFVALTSADLAKSLGQSQQTASNRILELLKKEYIQRKLGTRKQRIKITKKGYGLLKREYADYTQIFKPAENIQIQGKVSEGLGEGQYYVAQYKNHFRKHLGFTPFEGTLNLTVDSDEMDKLSLVPGTSNVIIEGFETKGRSFGTVTCLRAFIDDVECAVVIPKRSHHNNVIEVVAEYNLRKNLGVSEGDELVLSIEI